MFVFSYRSENASKTSSGNYGVEACDFVNAPSFLLFTVVWPELLAQQRVLRTTCRVRLHKTNGLVMSFSCCLGWTLLCNLCFELLSLFCSWSLARASCQQKRSDNMLAVRCSADARVLGDNSQVLSSVCKLLCSCAWRRFLKFATKTFVLTFKCGLARTLLRTGAC